MANILGTSFATSGFSFDPNLSPNNASFAAAVRAVMNQNGYTVPGSGLPAGDFANPAHSVSLTATNGTATTAMRSDGAPALDVTISPTWTGSHTFSAVTQLGSGVGAVIGNYPYLAWGTGAAAMYRNVLQIGPTSGVFANGISDTDVYWTAGIYHNGTNYIYTGTSSNTAGTSTAISIFMNRGTFAVARGATGTAGGTAAMVDVFHSNGTVAPTIQGYGPTAAGLVDMTPDTGSYSGSLTGGTNVPTNTVVWARAGNLLVLNLGGVSVTSNATTMTLTGGNFPAPAHAQNCAVLLQDNGGVFGLGGAQFGAGSTTITFQKSIGTNGGFTASGVKGVGNITIATLLN